VAVPRQHGGADPTVCDWRVRLLHALAGGNGRALGERAERGMETPSGLERAWRGSNGSCGDRASDHQVHARRVDRRSHHPVNHLAATHDSSALRSVCRGDQVHRPEPRSRRSITPSSYP
jgi:hypothetical protein